MAYFLHGSCWICGEEYEGLVFGGGFMNHTPIVPALDKETSKVVAVAYGETERYRYYTDPSMYESGDDIDMIQWNDLYLSAEQNYCPECEEFSMDFEVTGEGD